MSRWMYLGVRASRISVVLILRERSVLGLFGTDYPCGGGPSAVRASMLGPVCRAPESRAPLNHGLERCWALGASFLLDLGLRNC